MPVLLNQNVIGFRMWLGDRFIHTGNH